MRRRVAGWLLGGYLAFAAGLTVGPLPEQRMLGALVFRLSRTTGLAPWTSERLIEPTSNVLLFVPIGLLLCWVLPQVPRVRVWWWCTLASIGIELCQGAFLPARTMSLLDVLTNSLGAGIGVLLHRVVQQQLADRAGRRAQRLQ